MKLERQMRRKVPTVLRLAPEKPWLEGWITDVGMRFAGRFGVGLDLVFGSRACGEFGILTYHRTAPWPRGCYRTETVHPDRFREQIAGLQSRGFIVWPLSRVVAASASGSPIPPRTVVITFDDGFRSVYTYAWPILKELNAPATIFLCTGYLDGTDPFPFDDWGRKNRDGVPVDAYRPLTTAQCLEMAQDELIEFGAHSHTHEDFRGRPDEFREDVQKCVDILRSMFLVNDLTFAFPVGSPHRGFTSPELTEAAKSTGVTCGLTTECTWVKPSSDPFHWGRFNAFNWDTSATLAAKLDGWYYWAAELKRKVFRPFVSHER